MYYNVTHKSAILREVARTRFDIEDLDDVDSFEVDDQLIHLYKHEGMDLCDVYEVWMDDPLFYPAKEEGWLTG